VLYAAVTLDPDMKLRYLEIEWINNPSWVEIIPRQSKELSDSEYKALPQHITTTPYNQNSSFHRQNPSTHDGGSSARASIVTTDPTLSQWKKTKRARITHEDMDQWDQFQRVEEVEKVDDLLGYWSTRLKNLRWTQLSHMALVIHSIAAMSAQVERVFNRLVQSSILSISNLSLYLY